MNSLTAPQEYSASLRIAVKLQPFVPPIFALTTFYHVERYVSNCTLRLLKRLDSIGRLTELHKHIECGKQRKKRVCSCSQSAAEKGNESCNLNPLNQSRQKRNMSGHFTTFKVEKFIVLWYSSLRKQRNSLGGGCKTNINNTKTPADTYA